MDAGKIFGFGIEKMTRFQWEGFSKELDKRILASRHRELDLRVDGSNFL